MFEVTAWPLKYILYVCVLLSKIGVQATFGRSVPVHRECEAVCGIRCGKETEVHEENMPQ